MTKIALSDERNVLLTTSLIVDIAEWMTKCART